MNLETVQPCPMCGRMVSTGLTTCPGCGERLDSGREPLEVEPQAVREVDFRVLLNLLGIIWIGWGLFSGCAGVLSLRGFVIHYREINSAFIIMIVLLEGLTWFVSGLAALQKEMWGVYLGHVFSYLFLLVSLLYFEPIGILIAVVFILLSRHVLKQYRRLKESGASFDKK